MAFSAMTGRVDDLAEIGTVAMATRAIVAPGEARGPLRHPGTPGAAD